MNTEAPRAKPTPWNKGKMTGQKAPLKLRDIWAIRLRLQLGDKKRDLALFNLAIDSKLRACDLIKLRVSDIAYRTRVSSRAIVVQTKTGRPVQFEITEQPQEGLLPGHWYDGELHGLSTDGLMPSACMALPMGLTPCVERRHH